MTAHDVAADGDCFFSAVLDSARLQGVGLPDGVGDVASMRGNAAGRLGSAPNEFVRDLLVRTPGRYVAEELPDQVLHALTFGLVPEPTEQVWEVWRRDAADDHVRGQALAVGLDPGLALEVLLASLPGYQPPTIAEIDAQVDAAWLTTSRPGRQDALTDLIDLRDPATLAALSALAGDGPIGLPGVANPEALRLFGATAALVRLVVGLIRGSATEVTALDLLDAAMRDHVLWDTTIGDDIPNAFTLHGVNVVIVEDGRINGNPDLPGTVYISRVNRSHYQALQPTHQPHRNPDARNR
jgi:hypothetical protein